MQHLNRTSIPRCSRSLAGYAYTLTHANARTKTSTRIITSTAATSSLHIRRQQQQQQQQPHRSYRTSSWLQFSTSARTFSAVETPEHLDEKEAGIYAKLAEKLNPSRLDVRDISGGCGSMYAVEIESPTFRGLTTLKMHRQVQDILAEDIKGWHGIQLKTKATPSE